MDPLYDQLLRLQHMPNAFTEWSGYRNDLTDFIIDHTDSGKTVLIIGAGACNDYDIGRLLFHFSKIILLDRNE